MRGFEKIYNQRDISNNLVPKVSLESWFRPRPLEKQGNYFPQEKVMNRNTVAIPFFS